MIYKIHIPTGTLISADSEEVFQNNIIEYRDATQEEINAFLLETEKKQTSKIAGNTRKEIQHENFSYNGHTFYKTEKAQFNIMGYAVYILFQVLRDKNLIRDVDLKNIPAQWTDVDNQNITFNGLDIVNIFQAILQGTQKLYLSEAELQTNIKTTQNLQEIQAIQDEIPNKILPYTVENEREMELTP